MFLLVCQTIRTMVKSNNFDTTVSDPLSYSKITSDELSSEFDQVNCFWIYLENLPDLLCELIYNMERTSPCVCFIGQTQSVNKLLEFNKLFSIGPCRMGLPHTHQELEGQNRLLEVRGSGQSWKYNSRWPENQLDTNKYEKEKVIESKIQKKKNKATPGGYWNHIHISWADPKWNYQ